MDTNQLIREVRHSALHLVEHEVESVPIPTLAYRDWLDVFHLEDETQTRERFRMNLKRDFYLRHFLKQHDVSTETVFVRKEPFLSWLTANGEAPGSFKETMIALNRYAMKKPGPPRCKHVHDPGNVPSGRALVGTVTLYGETSDWPEAMSAVAHLLDGTPLAFQNVLAIDHSPEEAGRICLDFLDSYSVQHIFKTPGVVKPEFCEDCGDLLIKVADPEEVGRILCD